jgi:hypothetical protein
VPALRQFVQQFVDIASRAEGTKVYDANGGEIDALRAVETFVKYVNDNTARLFTVVSGGADDKSAQSTGDAAKDVDALTRKYALEHKLGYAEAMRAVFDANPLLKDQYLAQFQQVG